MTLTATELDLIRTHAETLLPSTCTIQTRSTVPDGMGGVIESWADTYTNVSCRLDTMKVWTRSDASGEQFRVHNAFTLFVPYNQAIASGDRVIFDDDTYEVRAVNDNQDWRALRSAVVVRID